VRGVVPEAGAAGGEPSVGYSGAVGSPGPSGGAGGSASETDVRAAMAI